MWGVLFYTWGVLFGPKGPKRGVFWGVSGVGGVFVLECVFFLFFDENGVLVDCNYSNPNNAYL
jgi:hypothetical protein